MAPKFKRRGIGARKVEGSASSQTFSVAEGGNALTTSSSLQYPVRHPSYLMDSKEDNGGAVLREGGATSSLPCSTLGVEPLSLTSLPVASQKENTEASVSHPAAVGTVPFGNHVLVSSSPTYWMAKRDVLLFYGPLGEPIGSVDKGTVVREISRYEDPFGGVWFGALSSDHSLVWLSFFDPEVHPMEDPGELHWEPVMGGKGSPGSAVGRKKSEEFDKMVEFRHPFRTRLSPSPVGPSNFTEDQKNACAVSLPSSFATWCFPQKYMVDLVRGTAELPSDLVFIEYYWKHVAEVSSSSHVGVSLTDEPVNWNYRYQCALEHYFFGSRTDSETFFSTSCTKTKDQPHSKNHSGEHKCSGSLTNSTGVPLSLLSSAVQEGKAAHEVYKEEVEACLKEFKETAENVVMLLAENLIKLPSSKNGPFVPHPVYRHVFYYKKEQLLLQVIMDTPSGSMGGTEAAVKLWRQRFRFMQMIAMESSKHFMSHPLYAMVEIKGMHVVVLAIPPVQLSRCLYAPLALAHPRLEMSSSSSPVVAQEELAPILPFFNGLGRGLNFKEHTVHACKAAGGTTTPIQRCGSSASEEREGGNHTWKTTLPTCTELYAGEDERFYIFYTAFSPPIPPLKGPKMCEGQSLEGASSNEVCGHFGSSSSFSTKKGMRRYLADRALPNEETPVFPRWQSLSFSRKESFSSDETLLFLPSQQLFSRVRPEILRTLPQPINPDAFIQGCYNRDDELHLLSVSEYLRGNAISAVADMIGFHRALDGVVIHPAVTHCALCNREMSQEMRLVVCYNPEKCCKICSHCYCERMSAAYNSASGSHPNAREEALTRVHFKDAKKCGHRGRKAMALLLEPSISEIMHSQGLNLCYLPFVSHRLPMDSRPLVGHFLLAEMCGRVGAKLLDAVLETAVERSEMHQRASKFLASFLSSHGPAAETLWSKEVGPAIMRKYPALGGPISLAYMSSELLAEKIQERSGVLLTKESFSSLRTGKRKKANASRTPSETSSSRSQSTASVSSRSSSLSVTLFIEVENIVPRSRCFLTPHVSMEESTELKKKLSASIEQLLLFWISYGSSVEKKE